VNSDYTGGNYNATIDTVSSGIGFQPIRNLNLGTNAQYTNNLGGTLYQSILSAGGIVPTELLRYSTHSLDINTNANYVLPSLHLTFGANADRREQTAMGHSISSNTFNEMVTYGNDFFGGFLNATGGVTQTSVDTANSPNSLGLFGNVSYTHRIQRWNLSGAINYSRNTQTVLIGYTSSGYGYSAGIGRRIGNSSHWSFNATGTKSNYNNIKGSGSFSQGYSTGLSLKIFSLNASYARVSGTSIVTPTGLTPVNIPLPILTPAEVIMFGGKSYSFGAATTPIRGLTLSAIYSKMRSNTTGISSFSHNSNIQMSTQLQYKLRQLWITGGYLRLVQGISIVEGPPVSSSSFFIGISRWLNFF